jgi:hypothetical protein
MGPETVGRVVTEATIENLKDLWDAERGWLPLEKVRRVIIPDALVDTGATLLSLPTGLSASWASARIASEGSSAAPA